MNTARRNSGFSKYVTILVGALIVAPVGAVKAAEAVKSAAAPAAQPYKWKTPKLNKAQIDALLAKPEKLLVIDVRRPDELTNIGGLPVYLSVQSGDLEKYLAYVPRDRNIVTVSNHAGRAGSTGDYLTSKGYTVVGAIGVQNYEEEGGTLTKIAPQAPKSATAAVQ